LTLEPVEAILYITVRAIEEQTKKISCPNSNPPGTLA